MVTDVAHQERWTIWIVGGTTTSNTRIAITIVATTSTDIGKGGLVVWYSSYQFRDVVIV